MALSDRYLTRFTSVWAKDFIEYLKSREQAGFNAVPMAKRLLKLDRFCNERKLSTRVFTREDAEAYRLSQNHEAPGTRYHRVNTAKVFFETMLKQGLEVTPPRNVSYKSCNSFVPHIYTEEERVAYFRAVDTYNYGQSGRCAIIMPLLFRLLACNGLRIGETLCICKCDVDLESGVIRLRATKNGAERYTVLSQDLLTMMRSYASKTFYQINDNAPIFWGFHALNKHVAAQTIYRYHVEFLHAANIPYNGEHTGPRVHDWRWTAAVMSCKQLVDQGMDMHTSLVYLAQWLGHRSTKACEYYLRFATTLFPYLCSRLDDTLEHALKALGDSLEVPDEVD